MKIERTRIHFFSQVFGAIAVLGSYGPYYVARENLSIIDYLLIPPPSPNPAFVRNSNGSGGRRSNQMRSRDRALFGLLFSPVCVFVNLLLSSDGLYKQLYSFKIGAFTISCLRQNKQTPVTMVTIRHSTDEKETGKSLFPQRLLGLLLGRGKIGQQPTGASPVTIPESIARYISASVPLLSLKW